MSPRKVTGLLDALEATGFVSRTPHPADRRATLIQLTDKGAAAARARSTGQAEFARYLFGDLSQAELDQFRQQPGITGQRRPATPTGRAGDTALVCPNL